MPSNSTVEVAIDPAEVAYWNQRRLVWRRRLLIGLIAATLLITFVGWKVVRHLTAAGWLEANQYTVDWTVDKENWKQGGSTAVRYGTARFPLFSNEKPVFDLKFLGALHRLEELNLATLSGIHDDDLARLDDLASLRILNLDRSHQPSWSGWNEAGLTDATLPRIGRLTRLVELNLAGQKITDAGLKNLAGLDELRKLDLDETEISDAGLEHLKALRGLKSVDLTGTKVTAQGISDFEAARPGVKVLADPPSTAPTPAIPR